VAFKKSFSAKPASKHTLHMRFYLLDIGCYCLWQVPISPHFRFTSILLVEWTETELSEFARMFTLM